MSRNIMTPGEIRVSNILDTFFNGSKPKREKEDKPDYLINLNNGKSLGIEIIEFKPILANNSPYQSIENPIFKIDEELHNKYNNINSKNKDYYVTFFVNDLASFKKDKSIIDNILSEKNYTSLENANYKLTPNITKYGKDLSNYFEFEKSLTITTNYNGLFFLEPLHTVKGCVNEVLVDWLEKYIEQKNSKIFGYEKTDLTALAIEDTYYSNFLSEENFGTKKRWELAYNQFLNNYDKFINFDYIFIVTKNKVFKIN